MPPAKLKTLLFSTLYPSSVRPGHGIFVETRLRELLRSGDVDTRVIAPVPWFPSTNPAFGSYAAVARTPLRECRNGIDVLHPRYALLPRVGMSLAPFGLALGARSALRQLLAEGFDFDVIDAHYFYPDGVAAALLARWFSKPFTITARGSDLNLLATHTVPRLLMQRAARRSQAAIGVCKALVDILQGWGIEPQRLHVMRNGVDLQRFQPRPQADCRTTLGISGRPVVLSVGNLVELKGHELVIEAMATIRQSHAEAQLIIVGAGPLRASLEAKVRALDLTRHVRFTGGVPQSDLVDWYSAADVLVLASSREGWANVLLEAMACGTPVVATPVGGTPEVITSGIAGDLIGQRSASAIAAALLKRLSQEPSRAEVRQHAEHFGWEATSRAQLDLFDAIARVAREHSHA